ncbi:hypothetical protein SLA2020_372400 [Shorea laevis]
MLTAYFLIRVSRPSSSPRLRSSSWSSPLWAKAQPSVRRRSIPLWGESYDGETGSSSGDEDNESSDGGSISWRGRVRRRTTPDKQQCFQVLMGSIVLLVHGVSVVGWMLGEPDNIGC